MGVISAAPHLGYAKLSKRGSQCITFEKVRIVLGRGGPSPEYVNVLIRERNKNLVLFL